MKCQKYLYFKTGPWMKCTETKSYSCLKSEESYHDAEAWTLHDYFKLLPWLRLVSAHTMSKQISWLDFFSPAQTVIGRYSLLLKGLRCFWSSHLAIIIWPFQKSLRSARLPIFLTSHGLRMITTVLLCGIQTWKKHTFWSRSTATRIKKYSSIIVDGIQTLVIFKFW